ncbi:MAG TPA: DUF72 domain-containing protein [Ignavibacteriaceae bacterium]|nr:DUF72 domain-containing protein [Ignavibacteriaceae bacterium]
MNKKGLINIGTSGWSYKHWKNEFYPEELKYKDWFKFYTSKFLTVELNASFYNLPKFETFENWYNKSPESFKFSLKASRYITHLKKLVDVKESVDLFFKMVKGLKEKAEIILFQLPPSLKYDTIKLSDFLSLLPENYRYTIEFRNSSWWQEDVYEILKKHNVAFCIFELAGVKTPVVTTADYVYLRLHGPTKGKYQGSYSAEQLKEWVKQFKKWSKEGKDVYCYFDNDEKGYAAHNALTINKMIKS